MRAGSEGIEFSMAWDMYDHTFNTWEPKLNVLDSSLVRSYMANQHHVARKSAPGTIAGAEKKSRLSDLFPCRRTSQRLALDLWLPPTSNQRPNRGAPAS